MKASNDTKNDAIITALQGLVTKDTGTKYQLWISDFNAVRVLLLNGCASDGSRAGFGYFTSALARSTYNAHVGFFTTVKLD